MILLYLPLNPYSCGRVVFSKGGGWHAAAFRNNWVLQYPSTYFFCSYEIWPFPLTLLFDRSPDHLSNSVAPKFSKKLARVAASTTEYVGRGDQNGPGCAFNLPRRLLKTKLNQPRTHNMYSRSQLSSSYICMCSYVPTFHVIVRERD